MKRLWIFFVILLIGCADTAVTPVAQNQIRITTSSAPICRRTGASRVALAMAAVETLRRGYTRFIILNAYSESNVYAIEHAPTYSTTTSTNEFRGGWSGGTFTGSGSGNSRTQYGGAHTSFYGSNDADLNVVMLKKGDRHFSNGVDAKSTLGENWKELVENGVKTCI